MSNSEMNTQLKKVKIYKQRELNTYAEVWRVSYWTLDQAKKELKGSYFQIISSLMFTAFTLEAYLNHIGKIAFTCWDDLESLPPKKKLNLLAEKFGVKTDYSKRPFQTIKRLIDFRNAVAHGKTKILKSEVILSFDDSLDDYMHKTLEAEWEQYCTLINAERARGDVENVIRQFHTASKSKEALFFTGLREAGATLIHD
jgi:hypothetical protein